MKKVVNPFTKQAVVIAGRQGDEAKTDLHVSGDKVVAGAGALENSQGDINAYSKKDLVNKMLALASASASGLVQKGNGFDAARAEQAVTAAMSDTSGQGWAVVGEVMGDEIVETMGRDGLVRKVLTKKDLKAGELPRQKIRKKDVLAFEAVNATGTVASHINQSYIYPSEFYIKGMIKIDNKEIEQNPGDILDDKYVDGLEQMMVVEDLVLKRLLDSAAPSYNLVQGFPAFTPTVFAEAQNQLNQWNLSCATAILAVDLLKDVLSNPEFSTYFDPVSKREIIQSGTLGQMFGTQIITDGYRYETLKVLNQGESYFLSAPNALGTQFVRKDVTSTALNLEIIGEPMKGWFFQKILAMSLANGRAVVKSVKL